MNNPNDFKAYAKIGKVSDEAKEYELSEIIFTKYLSKKDSQDYITALIYKLHVLELGRYLITHAWTNLWNMLEEKEGISLKDKPNRPHIKYLNKEEFILCEKILREYLYDRGVNYTEVLVEYKKKLRNYKLIKL